eukprot:gene4172-7482_t
MSKQFKRDMSKDIDVAIAEKRAYDFLVRSQEAKQYIEDMIQEKLPGSSADLVSNLRDGQYLCRLANIFTNNSIKKIHQIQSGSLLEFMATDNLNNFFKACKAVKFGEHYFFTIPDIWDKKNIVKVIACVHALAHYLTKHQITKVKIKDLSKVGLKFDEDEIKRTKEELDKLEDDPGGKPMIAPPSRHDVEDDEEGDDEGSEDLELADPDECVVDGEGISKAQAGETAVAKITAKDNLGNTIDVGGEEFSAILFNKNDKKIKVVGKVKDNDDGTYTITYIPEVAGEYELEVYLHDIQDDDDEEDFEKMLLKGCPFPIKVVSAKKSDPTKCALDGIGSTNSTAGTETTFTIQSFDEFGNKGNGGENYEVTLTGDGESVVASVKDLQNGSYEVSYTAPKSGEYDLSIKVGDKSMGKDQKIIVKDAGISDPASTDIEGIDIDGVNSLMAGDTFKFTVVAKDKHGNVRESGGEKFTATLISTSEGNKQALDMTKVLENVSDDAIDALFQKYDKDSNEHIDRTEFESFVKEVTALFMTEEPKDSNDDEPIVSKEKHDEYTKRKEIADSLLNFNDYDTDNDSKITKTEFKSHLQKLAQQQPIRSSEVPIVDLQNGRYDASATFKHAGDYEIQVKLDNKEVGKPIKIHVDPIEKTSTKASTYKTKADISQIKAGETTKFVIESRDEFGNLRSKGGETFTARVSSKTKKEILEGKVKVADNENGTYDVTFDLEEVGEYALEVLLGDEYVGGFPIENIVIKESGVTDPKRNVVDGEGLHDGTSKKPGQFTITTYDKFGNTRTTGGDKVTTKFVNKQKNLSFDGEVTDLGDGTYEVNYLYEVPVDTEFEVELIHNGVNFFEDKPQVMKLKGLKIKEIAEDQLLVIQDHDLLNSLLNLFKEEETESFVGKIQEIREKLISQIKTNFGLESDVKDVEKKIELLIQNRIKAEEVHAKKKTKKKAVVEASKIDGDTTKYSHLFYLLQTQPKYLSTCLYMVPPEKVETFLETVILTLYGYAFSAREEYLILNLFKQALQLEVERDNKKVGSFLNNNPVLPKMVMTYGRRLQGKTYLQKVLFDKIIDPILKIKKLDLELNAVKLLKTYLSDQEVETGVKNTEIDVKNLTYERAMKEEHIATKINERIAKLSEICSGVLQGMADYVDEMPYGLRYVCKQLDNMLLEKHQKSTESERASVIGYIVYYRFMNPALVSPDGFELTKDPIKPVMRTNLILISKVMTNLSNNARFDKKLEEHMTVMNEWLEKNESPYVDFIRKLTNVQDPEDSLGVDEYMELTQKTNPTITIKWNEIFLTHAVLLKYLHKLATEKDDPLKIILSEPGMDKAPEELPKDQDEEIKLPLINRFAEKTTKATASADQLYESAKESFRTILKSLPTDQIGTSVKDTLSVAKKYAEQDQSDEKSKSILGAVNQIETVLPVLIENGKVQEKTEYREIIVDITKEIQSAKVLLVKQKKEFERLKDSLASLEGHQKFLEEKIEDFKSYVTQSVVNDVVPSKKTHKFTYAQLEKKGVIKDMTVMKSQRNRVKFNISMETPGVFKVDAKVGGITVKTIEIKLEELLSMKARGNDKLDYEYVILDVNMTLHVMNKLFMSSK